MKIYQKRFLLFFMVKIFTLALICLTEVGCFGGDKMMQIERRCREVTITDSGDIKHVKLIHPKGWNFAEGWKMQGAWDGEVRFYRPDGSLYKMYTFQKGRLEGNAAFYYPNGQLATRAYLKQNKNGIGFQSSNVVCFSPTGESVTETEFDQKKFWSIIEQWMDNF